jgi:hypothetical protein
LIKFKNGQYIYDSTKLEHLDNFLNKLIWYYIIVML